MTMRRILIRALCVTAFTSAAALAQPPVVKEGTAEREVRPPVKSVEVRAAEAKALEQRHCSNDVSPAEVRAKDAPAPRDPLLRVPAGQKAALKQALPPGRWSPQPVSLEKVRAKAQVSPE